MQDMLLEALQNPSAILQLAELAEIFDCAQSKNHAFRSLERSKITSCIAEGEKKATWGAMVQNQSTLRCAREKRKNESAKFHDGARVLGLE